MVLTRSFLPKVNLRAVIRPAHRAPVKDVSVEFSYGNATGTPPPLRHKHDLGPRHSPLYQEQDLAQEKVPTQFFRLSSSVSDVLMSRPSASSG